MREMRSEKILSKLSKFKTSSNGYNYIHLHGELYAFTYSVRIKYPMSKNTQMYSIYYLLIKMLLVLVKCRVNIHIYTILAR